MDKEIVKVELEDGKVICLAVNNQGGEQDVSGIQQKFKQVADDIESFSNVMLNSIKKIKPQKATVEFGLEFTLESGKLVALIADGSFKSNIKITLEWSDKLLKD